MENLEKKIFYRVANAETKQGLWYNMSGEFTGLIHDKFSFCKKSELPMPFDDEVVGYLSATDSREELGNWFTEDDISRLGHFGYVVTVYEAHDYKFYRNHWLINQKSSEVIMFWVPSM